MGGKNVLFHREDLSGANGAKNCFVSILMSISVGDNGLLSYQIESTQNFATNKILKET